VSTNWKVCATFSEESTREEYAPKNFVFAGILDEG